MADYQKFYVNPKKGNLNSNYRFYHNKQFHSRRTRLSVFNHYIEFGSVPRESDTDKSNFSSTEKIDLLLFSKLETIFNE